MCRSVSRLQQRSRAPTWRSCTTLRTSQNARPSSSSISKKTHSPASGCALRYRKRLARSSIRAGCASLAHEPALRMILLSRRALRLSLRPCQGAAASTNCFLSHSMAGLCSPGRMSSGSSPGPEPRVYRLSLGNTFFPSKIHPTQVNRYRRCDSSKSIYYGSVQFGPIILMTRNTKLMSTRIPPIFNRKMVDRWLV